MMRRGEPAMVLATARCSKDGHITSWSQGMEARYGFTSAQAIGRVQTELLRTSFMETRLTAESALADLGYWRGDVLNHHTDGRGVPTCERWDIHAGANGETDFIKQEHCDPQAGALFEARQFVGVVDTIARDICSALTAIGAYTFGTRVLMEQSPANLEAIQHVVAKQTTQHARAAAAVQSLRLALNSQHTPARTPPGHNPAPGLATSATQATDHPAETELMASLAEWVRFEEQIKATMDLPEQSMSHRALDAVLEPLFEGQHALIDRLCALQNSTQSGQCALARVILLMGRDDPDGDGAPWSADHQDRARMISALVRDVASGAVGN